MKKKKLLTVEIIILIIFAVILVMTFCQESNKDALDEYTIGASEENLEADVECIEVETPYATLRFPKEWMQAIRMEILKEDTYTVQFFGTLEGEKKVHLSDIIFDGEKGYTVGYIDVGNEMERVPVNIVYYELGLEEGHTEEQVIEIQKMQGAVEFVLDELSNLDTFLPAE